VGLVDDLLIPVALGLGKRPYKPEEAKKGWHYFCPGCGGEVVVRQGEIRVWHFAHKDENFTCNQESIIHQSAKYMIWDAVLQWKLGNQSVPKIERSCRDCGEVRYQPVPDRVDEAQAAVEVFVTHEVGQKKTQRISIPFIEVDGYEIIENPFIWQPIKDGFKEFFCDGCKRRRVDNTQKIEAIAKRLHLE
jgi:hypothetical protein